ncbi:hypothetical protein BDV35DRAFT_337951 [Aspergillus flavus]|uniref:Uncharacterized protein n=1 Tax=Aspergillus flavus TaxID=5059 RepID=A0A5N6HBW6_ASPFL|nr:hypothetical protein BDV35DRAFT_337951 [Aspergillus flavus]
MKNGPRHVQYLNQEPYLTPQSFPSYTDKNQPKTTTNHNNPQPKASYPGTLSKKNTPSKPPITHPSQNNIPRIALYLNSPHSCPTYLY